MAACGRSGPEACHARSQYRSHQPASGAQHASAGLRNQIGETSISGQDVGGWITILRSEGRGFFDCRLPRQSQLPDPFNSSIACRQTGPILVGDIDRSDEGESVFSERRSIVWKSLNVKRILDEDNQTLIYIAHARDVQNGSAKMSISTVPLFQN
ncbi:CreA family protein [Roseobacter cerasinus]|uniref:CreA family protein n=1 Tax=Roseobacter cerasinus TaxID=2602289 RepID=UPI003F688421